MKYTVLSLLISIAALLTINYVTYKLVPAKISAIHRKSKWKYKANSSKNSLKTEFRIALFSLNSSSATSKNAKLRTSTEAINTFRCSDNVELYKRNTHKWEIVDRNFCSQKYPDLLLLIVAITATEQREHRNLIRKTWGDVKLYKNFKTAVLFPLGRTSDLEMMTLIQKEQQKYGDIIQQDFLDTYKNLTLKFCISTLSTEIKLNTLMWLQFLNDFCPNVTYVLKIDADITFNYFKLVEILQNRTQTNASHSFVSKSFSCYIIDRAKVNRYDSKWPISYMEYPRKYFPRYCSGSFYLLTGDLAGPLLEQARFCTLFWIEDVHVTGHLGMRVQARYEDWSKKIVFKWNQLEQLIKAPDVLFTLIYTPWEHIQLWKWLKNYYGYNNKYEEV
uniref:Hexosyltransferase n=1 Tax=Onchocerca volvulus TaxID=6282 RepID=A0A8R1TSR9_ONCVO